MQPASTPSALRGPWLIVLLAALQAFGPLSIDMYLAGLPAIATDLHTDASQTQLTISAFLLGLFGGMLLYGPLSDKYGRRPLLLLGIALYALACVGCLLADSIGQLIALRIVQALGGAAAAVLGRAIVRDLFAVSEAARILSLMHLVTMLATLAAPVLGGYLMLALGWRALFAVLLLFALLTWLAVWRFIPETHHGDARQASLLSVFRAYGQIGRQPMAIGYVLCTSLSFAGMFAYITASPFVYIDYFGVLPQHYGWLFGLNILGVIVLVSLNARLVGEVGPERMLVYGTRLSAISGMLLIICGLTSMGGLPLLVLGLLGYVSVTGLIGSNCMASLLAHFPHQAGAAAGMAVATQFGLGALASSVTSALHDGTPLPMTMMVGGCALGCLAALSLTRQRPAVIPATDAEHTRNQ